MNKIKKKYFTSILTVLMAFSILLPIYGEVVDPIDTTQKIAITMEIKGDAQMGTIYKQDLEVELGISAFDLLKAVVMENNIELEYDEKWNYVTGINGLKQMDKGPNSGWLYKVNGLSPDVGAGEKILTHADHVSFYYTLDYMIEDEPTPDKAKDYADQEEVSAWAQESVDKAINLGIIGGDDKGRINPQNNITRAEFVTLLLTVMNTEPDVSFSGMFNDVQEGAWYANVVEKAAQLDLIKGMENGDFLPNQTISRQDMAVVLTRAYELDGNAPSVADVHKISPYALKSVGSVIDNKVMSGTGDKNFDPLGKVTREMAISVMVRILDSL